MEIALNFHPNENATSELTGEAVDAAHMQTTSETTIANKDNQEITAFTTHLLRRDARLPLLSR